MNYELIHELINELVESFKVEQAKDRALSQMGLKCKEGKQGQHHKMRYD